MIEIEVFHTHLYPGAKGRVTAGSATAAETPAVLLFADGMRADARLSGSALTVAGYRTAAGTRIASKSWRLSFDGPDVVVTARIA